MKDLTDRARLERLAWEANHGRGEWPPTLPPPDRTIGTMLEWHARGCEWPVGGDETTIARSANARS